MNMRVLAVDWGEKRLGFAVSDETATIARALGIVECGGDKARKKAVREKLEETGAGLVIVGLPLTLGGIEGESAREAKRFAEALERSLDVPVRLVDERLTTSLAERVMRESNGRGGKSRKKGKKKGGEKKRVDDLAASILLQGYLDSVKTAVKEKFLIPKKRVSSLLMERKFDRLVELYEQDRRVRKALRLRLYDADEAVRLAAIETMGMVMGRLWRKGEHEKVIEYVRSQIWTITEESGGIGWSAPQTIAQIIVNIPELMDPHGKVMISRALEEAPLVPNGLRAIGRLGGLAAPTLDLFRQEIARIFESGDRVTLALAAWAMGEAGFMPAVAELEKLGGRREPVKLFVGGTWREEPLGTWAAEAVDKIKAGDGSDP